MKVRNVIPVQLARKKIFTIDEAGKVFDLDRGSLKVILSRLEEAGWVERLERGKYMVIPLSARKGEYTLNEFVVGSMLVEPYAVAYWSALHYHGLTEQVPGTVFIQTTARRKRLDSRVFGVQYKVVKIVEYKFFGVDDVWIDGSVIKVTAIEKTIVDCLDHPEYCGGIIEVAKALKNEVFDYRLLAEYSQRINNSGVVRRLGYLCGLFDTQIDLPGVDTRNYLYLDPTMPHEGETDSSWRLKVNVDLGDLE